MWDWPTGKPEKTDWNHQHATSNFIILYNMLINVGGHSINEMFAVSGGKGRKKIRRHQLYVVGNQWVKGHLIMFSTWRAPERTLYLLLIHWKGTQEGTSPYFVDCHTFYPLEEPSRGHFTKLYPLEGRSREHFHTIYPLEGRFTKFYSIGSVL